MNTLITLLIGISLFSGGCFADEFTSDYEKIMLAAVDQLETMKTAEEVQVCKNTFERISRAYPDNWLPLYYTAYLNVELVYWDKKSKQNKARLQEAEKLLKQLNEDEKADRSEVETLWAYYYMCIISQDPMQGATLFQKTIAKFENAKELNGANPRPIILRAFFEQHLPSFVKTGLDLKAYKEEAAILFEKEAKNIEKPFWGKYFLQMIKIDTDNK